MKRSKRTTRSQDAFGRLLKIGAVGAAVFGTSAILATQAFAAGDCQRIKADIAKTGSYVYHYRDPAQPDLDLYRRFVGSSLKCSADAEAE